MTKLRLTGEQFKAFQKSLEKDQKKNPNTNVQIFVQSDSKTASGGFGFVFDSSVLSSLH
jgi:hypothetical protein